MRRWTATLALVGAVAFAGCAEPYDDEVEDMDAEVGVLEDEEQAPLNASDHDYSGWDTDQNRTLNRDEFGVWAAEDRGWGEMDREGFAATTLTLWDEDDDRRLSEAEWREGTERWLEGEAYGGLTDWDADGDTYLDADELHEGFQREGLYDRVDRDADAVIDHDEAADWFFDVFDVDGDTEIDATEWERGNR